MTTQIDCPTCERMGRVTVLTQAGSLTTATCATCNGEGVMFDHFDPDCKYCNAANAGAQPVTPLFAWTPKDVYA